MAKANNVAILNSNQGEPENFLLADYVNRPAQEPDMIIDDLWHARTMALITADGGTGKTHFALQMLYAIATGQDMPGAPFQISIPRTVVYISQEDEAGYIVDELFRQFPALKSQPEVMSRFRVISTAIEGSHLFLSELKSARYLISQIPDGAVFALDSWSTFLMSNENDAIELMKNEISMLRAIMKQTRATPLMIHHRPKKNAQTGHQSSSRGSTALPQHCRFHIMLESVEPAVKLSFEKVSRGLRPDPVKFIFDEDRRLFVPGELDRYVTIFALDEELTTSEIIKRLGFEGDEDKVRANILDALRRRSKRGGPLTKVSAGTKGHEAIWKRELRQPDSDI